MPSGKKLPSSKVNCLLALQNGELWIGTDGGLVQLAESGSAEVPPPLRDKPILAMIQDRDSNVWVGTAGGLFRVNAKGVSADAGNTAVTALFEDREGNVWVGGSHGIECLRDSAFVTYSPPGLNSESSGAIYVDPSDRVWYAPIEGGLRWMQGDKSGTVTNDLLSQDVVYSIAGSKDELWLGRQQGGLTNLRFTGGSFAARTYTERNGLAQNSVYTVHENPDGTVWAGTVSGGVSRLKDGQIYHLHSCRWPGQQHGNFDRRWPRRRYVVWHLGGLTELANGKWRTYTTRDGLPANNINTLLQDSAGTFWIGTAAGLAFLNSGRISVAGPDRSIARTDSRARPERSLWIATSRHVLRISRDGLMQGHLRDTDIRQYGFSDGLRGTEGVKRDRSVVERSAWRRLVFFEPGFVRGASRPRQS